MTSTSDNCKDVVSKSNDGVCDVNNMLQNMNMAVSVCANCGKENSSDNMNVCNKCKKTTYCNAACKKKHRHKHKKYCEEHQRLAAEHAAKLHDEKLFKQPPPADDCPICFLLLPSLDPTGKKYMSCCGKVICSGCVYAPLYDNQGNEVDNKKCPFCRTPPYTSDEELQERYKKRVALNDAMAIFNVGVKYRDGTNDYPQDYVKALEFYHRAAELGYTEGYTNIGFAYLSGRGVEVNKNKARYYCELAAIRGNMQARHNLGTLSLQSVDMNRAVRHFLIAVEYGNSESLETIKKMYSKGYATKEAYTKALKLYQKYLGEIKSVQRDKAAAADEENQYY